MRVGAQMQSLLVLLVATMAAAGFYGVSHTVAKERQALEETRDQVDQTRASIRRLKTELGTRASLRQLERWNAELLGLDVPGPGQFVTDARALATLDRKGVAVGRSAGPPIMVEAASATELADAGPAASQSALPTVRVASDVSISRDVTEKRRQRQAMVVEEKARPRKLAVPARAGAVAVAAVVPTTAAQTSPRAAEPDRSERLAAMEQRLAAIVARR